MKGVKVLLSIKIVFSDELKIIVEDTAADILVVDIRDSADALAGSHNQAGWDTADTGFLEVGMKDNQDFVLVAGCMPAVAAK